MPLVRSLIFLSKAIDSGLPFSAIGRRLKRPHVTVTGELLSPLMMRKQHSQSIFLNLDFINFLIKVKHPSVNGWVNFGGGVWQLKANPLNQLVNAKCAIADKLPRISIMRRASWFMTVISAWAVEFAPSSHRQGHRTHVDFREEFEDGIEKEIARADKTLKNVASAPAQSGRQLLAHPAVVTDFASSSASHRTLVIPRLSRFTASSRGGWATSSLPCSCL